MPATDDRAKELAAYINMRTAMFVRTQYEPVTSELIAEALGQVLDDQLALMENTGH